MIGSTWTSYVSLKCHVFKICHVSAIGVGMIRDSATVMIGQYFKKKRNLVEMMLIGSSGIGITLSSPFISGFLR